MSKSKFALHRAVFFIKSPFYVHDDFPYGGLMDGLVPACCKFY